jgi:DNA-binding GntR family transcriptional regulator
MKHIYLQLKEEIVWLELPPGRVLNLTQLAQRFAVSRTPIKEVLIALSAEDLVDRQGSHFVVKPLVFERIRALTEIREPIETQANLFALQRATPLQLATLAGLRDEILAVGPDADNRHLVRLDRRVHLTLFESAGNDFLKELCELLLNHYLRFWLTIPREINSESFFCDTLEIIRGVLERDEGLLRAASARHLRASVEEIRNFF